MACARCRRAVASQVSEQARPKPWQGQGTLATWPGYGTGNPRLFVSGRFTSLVNCGELVNPLNPLGELDF